MASQSHLDELLMQWEKLRQQGKPVAVEELCADTPELEDELRRRIDALQASHRDWTGPPASGASTAAYDQSAVRAPSKWPSIPGYEVLAELGQGGMGVVYKVRNLAIDRVEALKMMRVESPDMARRFQLEIHATARGDKNIVPIYFAGEHNGQPFFTMPYVEGGTLAQHLARFLGHPKAAAQLLAKVARAVHFMHAQKVAILHRDLKPSNILLKDNDEPLVSDFGLAKFLDGTAEPAARERKHGNLQLTSVGAVLGTAAYMSPEQAAGRAQEFTAGTDIWALGVILYELLTGEKPFPGASDAAIRDAILQTEPPAPHVLNPKADRHLEAICLKCLQKDPTRRYETAAAVADDLEGWLRGEAIVPESFNRRVWRKVRKHPTLSAATILLALFAFLLGGMALAYRLNNPPLPEPIQYVAGMPYSMPFGEGKFSMADGVIHVETDDHELRLFELFAKAPSKSYRFEAEVQDTAITDGAVGIYVARSSKAGEHWLCVLSFSEKGAVMSIDPKRGKMAVCRFTLQGLREPKAQQIFGLVTGGQEFFDGEKGRWRKLTLVVTPELIQTYWHQDKEPYWNGVKANLADMAQKQNDALPPAARIMQSPPEFAFMGGMGLFCQGSSGYFRNVEVIPIPDEK